MDVGDGRGPVVRRGCLRTGLLWRQVGRRLCFDRRGQRQYGGEHQGGLDHRKPRGVGRLTPQVILSSRLLPRVGSTHDRTKKEGPTQDGPSSVRARGKQPGGRRYGRCDCEPPSEPVSRINLRIWTLALASATSAFEATPCLERCSARANSSLAPASAISAMLRSRWAFCRDFSRPASSSARSVRRVLSPATLTRTSAIRTSPTASA